MKKKITDLNLKNKVVILRVDFNTPLKLNENNQYQVVDNSRIKAALKTIKYIIKQDAKLILLSHLSRIKTAQDLESKSLFPVYLELKKLLNDVNISFVNKTRGKEVEESVKNLKNQEILLLENTRFEDLNDKKESKNDPELAQYWASLGDVFINDAYGAIHRAHASNVGIATYIKESAIGFLVDDELIHLSKLNNPEKPYLAIVGGAKISDKIKVLESLLQKADFLLIGGAMAYTFNAAKNLKIGKSLFEADYTELAHNLLTKYPQKIILPIDNAISKEFNNTIPTYTTKDNPNILDDYMGMDIGPETVNLFKQYLLEAKTIFWNGPLGVTEFTNYAQGTKEIAKIISQNKQAFSVVGGGDSVSAIKSLKLENDFSFISTGGGASLEYIEGKILPGLEIIQNS
ncbi:phosphoglycerate kinase [Mycoplasma miroungirhinis]|uniref:Phosphoglycerate kinase n=1 Tax=Mycoplasma miroungirhinis TaxID=754516 RepID=A0A6M4JCT6_9MOLU|nr:phosphoglycerate kinase [Mycoplasma miroungirhinis]QJR43877.1 phosphoglycerate kinase [Mycoplasma miroungirhinis]